MSPLDFVFDNVVGAAIITCDCGLSEACVVPVTVWSQEPKRTSIENLHFADWQLPGYDLAEEHLMGCPWCPALLKTIGNDAPRFSYGGVEDGVTMTSGLCCEGVEAGDSSFSGILGGTFALVQLC
jgi:hypothetical protein